MRDLLKSAVPSAIGALAIAVLAQDVIGVSNQPRNAILIVAAISAAVPIMTGLFSYLVEFVLARVRKNQGMDEAPKIERKRMRSN